MSNKQYVIFHVTELEAIDFNEVLETSSETIRKSVDGTHTFVKWVGDVPECIDALTTKGEILTHEEMLNILSTEEWTPVIDNK